MQCLKNYENLALFSIFLADFFQKRCIINMRYLGERNELYYIYYNKNLFI